MEFESLTITPIRGAQDKPVAYNVRIHYRDRNDFSVIQEREYTPAPGDLEAMLIDIHQHVLETLKVTKNGSNNKSNGKGVPRDAQIAVSSNGQGK